jgi:hypothetical protein
MSQAPRNVENADNIVRSATAASVGDFWASARTFPNLATNELEGGEGRV